MVERPRIVVVDDHGLFRAGVRAELAAHCDVVGEAESPAQAVVGGVDGILVNVPDPARFALHKLLISQRRSVSEQTKADSKPVEIPT